MGASATIAAAKPSAPGKGRWRRPGGGGGGEGREGGGGEAALAVTVHLPLTFPPAHHSITFISNSILFRFAFTFILHSVQVH